jgi:uracil-DNA glycosylase
MDRKEEIFSLFNRKLFAEKLEMEDFLKRTPPNSSEMRLFACEHRDYCKVAKSKHPIWTPALGDASAKVMIVGEAPSATERPGLHFGGLFSDWENDPRSPVVQLRNWVGDNYEKTIPYFTDLAKCGVAKQQDKGLLKVRIPKCVDHLLQREIELLAPETILCLGNRAYDFVSELKTGDADIFKLLHWSNRGSLPLSIEDKKEIIWKWQTGKLSGEKLAEIPLPKIASNFWRKSKPA